MDNKKKVVFGAWPYANGPRHLGHASSLLPGDIVARYFRLEGNDTLYVSGSDMNGTPAEMAAENNNRPVELFTEEIARIIQKDFMLLGMSYDLYTHTRTQEHFDKTQEIMLALFEEKAITFGYAESAFELEKDKDRNDVKKSLQDRFIEGECPHCHQIARGDQCDFCGNLLNPNELINPKSKISSNPVIFEPTPHLFLNLQLFSEELNKWLKSGVLNIRKHAKNKSIQDTDTLRERTVTRDTKWGIVLPKEIIKKYPSELINKVMYVWFEAVIGYVSATIEYEKNFGDGDYLKWWELGKSDHYYSHGKDNVLFHTIFWPALLMGYNRYQVMKGGKPLQLPTHILSTNNLNYGEDKFSSSRGNFVGISDLISKYSQDAVRYYMISNSPENNDVSFTQKEMERAYGELSSNWGNAVNRVIKPLQKTFGGETVEFDVSEVGGDFLKLQILSGFKNVGDLIKDGKLKDAIKCVINISSQFNKYLAESKPWLVIKDDLEKARKILSFSVWIIDSISILFAPFTPESSTKVQTVLGNDIDLKGRFETGEKVNPDNISRQYYRYINPNTEKIHLWEAPEINKKYKINDNGILPLFPKLDK